MHVESPDPVRVLVVDDDEPMRELFVRQLRRLGVTHTVVATGDDAMTAARAEPFDLALLDERLVGETGEDVAARLRTVGRTVLVGISGARRGPSPAARGFDGFDEKPSTTDELAALLRRWLPAARSRP